MSPYPDEKKCCHHTGFSEKCRDLVMSGRCQNRWGQITGVNPNTGEAINDFACVDDHARLLALEQTMMIRSVSSEIEKLTNSIFARVNDALIEQGAAHQIEDAR